MLVDDFDFSLPEELIAQDPLPKRDASRLMVLDKNEGSISHESFNHVIEYLNPGDVLVLNNTKVIPARLHGIKQSTGAKIEVFLLSPKGDNIWGILAKPAKRLKVGDYIVFADDFTAEVTAVAAEGMMDIRLCFQGDLMHVLEKHGEVPLPPYIRKKLEDPSRYQTVYAKYEGSVAAPTAGLHFTEDILSAVKAKGVEVVFITLQVGLGTFRPVKVDKVEEHIMHSEIFELTAETAEILNKAHAAGGRIIAVGTTSVRTLESVVGVDGTFTARSGSTDIYIYPGYEYKAVNAIITNFHLPKSTLVMLVSAFAGSELIKKAYEEAISEKYRFFSFGDSMLIK